MDVEQMRRELILRAINLVLALVTGFAAGVIVGRAL